MSTIALAWSFATPGFSAAIVGGGKAAYLDAAAEAVQFELSIEDRESISKLYKPKPVVRPLLTSDVSFSTLHRSRDASSPLRAKGGV